MRKCTWFLKKRYNDFYFYSNAWVSELKEEYSRWFNEWAEYAYRAMNSCWYQTGCRKDLKMMSDKIVYYSVLFLSLGFLIGVVLSIICSMQCD